MSRGLAVVMALIAMMTTAPAPAHALVSWHRRTAPLVTPWTAMVSPGNALPEYPRPQMVRQEWLNLNGVWNYLARSSEPLPASPPESTAYPEEILVPYPPESALSGIQRHNDEMWYRKSVRLPSDWQRRHLLLHFGAVDQIATVWVNNKQVGRHEGGYTEFTVDITDALHAMGEQEIAVRVEDRNDANPFALGKQRNRPGGIFYSGASGIWQSVWMEPVAVAHIDKLDITPDLGGLTLTARTSETKDERALVFVSEPGGRVVATAWGNAGQPIRIPVVNPRLWSPADPYLYDLQVALVGSSGKVVDAVTGYAGLRTVGVVRDRQGRPRIALNGQITFLLGPLDQGYWPDGIYTAPTDAALKSDLDRVKDLGMNFVRKHGKVEPARWYYWADKLGLMVWQDMPSLDASHDPIPLAKRNFEHELLAMVDQLRSVTSIIGWVPFNEGWGEFDTARIANAVKAADPSRLVDANSGVNCCKSHGDSGAGDIVDDHTYVGPGRTPARSGDNRVRVDGEYGGLGLVGAANRWPGPPQSYEMTDSPAHLTDRYVSLSRALETLARAGGLSAAVYTQITDVENEVNGFLTYDRQYMKMAIGVVAERNRAVIAAGTPAPLSPEFGR